MKLADEFKTTSGHQIDDVLIKRTIAVEGLIRHIDNTQAKWKQ